MKDFIVNFWQTTKDFYFELPPVKREVFVCIVAGVFIFTWALL